MTILPNEPNDLSNTNIVIQPIRRESKLSGKSIYSMYFRMTRKCYLNILTREKCSEFILLSVLLYLKDTQYFITILDKHNSIFIKRKKTLACM